MKTLIAATLLLVSTAAFASTAAEWDCGRGVTATSDRGEFGFHMGKPYDASYPRRGTVKWDLRVTNKGTEIWLDGKACKRTN